MRPPNTNPYRLWSCLSVLPNLGNRQRHGQELRREGKRQRDTCEETDELERERWIRIYIYVYIYREKEKESEGRERGVEGTKVPQLRRCVDTSMKVSSEQAAASLPVSCMPNRKSIACDVYRNAPFNCDRALPLASKVIVALSKIAPRCTVLLNSPTRLRSVIFGRSRLLH